MKKLIISSTVGMLILFIWGFLAWAVFNLHQDAFKYTPGQEEVLKSITENMPESGTYMVPYVDVTAPDADEQFDKLHEQSMGKPFATIFYIKKGMHEGPMMFVWGLLIQFVSVFIVALILAVTNEKLTGFFQRWWLVMLFPLVTILQSHLIGWNYLGHEWHYIKEFIIDLLLSWGLCGAWLAYYFGRN